jgi:hypothetical protein
LGAIALIALFAQNAIQSREDHEQQEHNRSVQEHNERVQEQNRQILENLNRLTTGNRVTAKVEEATAEVVKQTAQIGPEISAELLRGTLIGRHPLASLVDDAFKAVGKEFHDTQCDFLYEVFVVNKSDVPVTIRDIVAEAELDGEWTSLQPMEDLTDYQIEFEDELVDNPTFVGGQRPRVADLTPNLAAALKGIPLTRGIGHQGWLRFGAVINTKDLKNPIPYRISLIDALGGVHPISTDKPLLRNGEFIHNTEVWSKRLRY